MNIQEIKQELSRVFDDDLHTKQWHNIVDYTIIALIIISTVEVFLSTFDGVVEKYGRLLHWVDVFTTVVFTVEVSLRIWCADLLDEKYKGFLGRIRYCFSFYGLIDILSTYPFYLNFVMNIPYTALKTLRIARLFRIFRYMKSFRLLSEAINSKKMELWVSLQFLFIVTIILSFILFFVEHDAQPDVYVDGTYPVVWAFAQYIGDPGGFAENPPITFVGRLIACLVGILGIAIFAVPAGLIGSGFTDAMDNDRKKKRTQENISRIIHSFKFEKDQHYTNLFAVPRFVPLNTILTRKYMAEADIITTVENSDQLHLYNLANAINQSENPEDKIVVVNHPKNTPYGVCIDRKSKVTVVSTSGPTEPITSWFAYHIAKLGGFNYVAKEIELDADNPITYFTISDVNDCPNLPQFIQDIDRLSSQPDSWVITILGAMGLQSRPHQFHFCYSSQKHDATYYDANKSFVDVETFDKIYTDVERTMREKFSLNSDKNEYYAVNAKNISHYLKCKNTFNLRVECKVCYFDGGALGKAQILADIIRKNIEPEKEFVLPLEMVTRQKGHDFGFSDYID